MDVVCLFRTVSLPDDLVYMWKDTISVLFKLKWCHEMDGGGMGLVWNSSFGSKISHSTFYRNKDLVSLWHKSTSVYTSLSDNMGGHL